jgi:hypothetical protein
LNLFWVSLLSHNQDVRPGHLGPYPENPEIKTHILKCKSFAFQTLERRQDYLDELEVDNYIPC